MDFIFDCDDVLLDWESGFIAFLQSIGYRPNPAGPADWNLAPWIGCDNDEARKLVDRFNDNYGRFRDLPSMQHAYEAVWAAHDAGHRVHVITCCGDSDKRKMARLRNLDQRFARWNGSCDYETPFTDIHILPMGSSKADALRHYPAGSYFFDDSIAHARTASWMGMIATCMRRSHNRDAEKYPEQCEGDLLIRWADDLRHVRDLVASLEAAA